MTGRTLEELAVGETARLERRITRQVVREFVAATGDDNPIHSDPAFAARTRFGEIVAPGILTGGLISAVIGTRLPGPGTVYLSQSFRFLKPVRLGDTVTARVEVAEVVPDKNRVRLATTCTSQRGEVVLDGEAWVMPSRARVEYRPPEPARVGRPAVDPLAAPAVLALEMLSLWMAGGLALARQALRPFEAYRPAPSRPDPARS
jgi:acyl dehydratase